jgi:hypothetical protein
MKKLKNYTKNLDNKCVPSSENHATKFLGLKTPSNTLSNKLLPLLKTCAIKF